MYENERARVFWDVPVYADSVMVKAKRIDARVVDKERKRVAVSLLTWLTKHNLLLNNQSSYRPNISHALQPSSN